MSRKSKLRLVAACSAAFVISKSAYAQTSYSWNTAADGNWTDAPNWTPNTGFPGAPDSATFNAPGVNGAETIYLGNGESVSTITFANTAATSFFTGASAAPVNNVPLTITNGGGLTVNSGAGAVTIGTGAANNNVQLVVSGTGTITNNSANLLTFDAGSDPTAYSVLNDTAQADTLAIAGSGRILVAGSMSQAGTLGLTMGGTGQTELAGTGSTFAGGITLNGGFLGVKGTGTSATISTVLDPAGTAETLRLNGGGIGAVGVANIQPSTLSVSFSGNATFGHTSTAPDGANYVAGISFAGPVDLGNAVRTLTLASNVSFTGVISNGGIIKLGTGTLVLGNQANTYVGGTTISAGTLSSTGSNALPMNGRLTLLSGTTFTCNNAGFFQIGSLSDGGGVGGKITLGNAGGCTLNIGFDNTNTTFSGQIQGNDPTGPTNYAGIAKVGTGTLTLTGSNIFNGINNKVSGGILEVTNVGNGGLRGQMSTTAASPTVTFVVPDLPDGSSPILTTGMTVDDGNTVALATTVAGIVSSTNDGSLTTFTLTLPANVATTTSGQASNVGLASGLGLADNSPNHLTLDGGTLQYVGSSATPASTDRLITVTPNGGAIDSSGAGPITFAGNTGTIFNGVSNALVYTGTVGTSPRTLIFTGSNTGANTFAPIIGDAADAPDPTGVTKTGAGQWVLTGLNTYTGPTSVSAGTLVLTQSQKTTTSVAITGGTLQLQDVGTHENIIHTGAVTITGGALDLADNKLITTTTAGTPSAGVYPSGSVQQMVHDGLNGGAWNGVGIRTSEATAQGANALTTLAVATASDVGYGPTMMFDGETLTGSETLVMYTYNGDMNLNGQITGDDYARIDAGFASAGALTGYENGDLNYDGKINADDYFIIDNNYTRQSLGTFPSAPGLGSLAGVSAVPEPASISVLALGAVAGLRRRRRS